MPSTCVIFDIDGTLVDTDGFEGRLYWAALRQVLGDVRIRADWREYEHVTDTGILRDVCRDNRLDSSDIEQRVRTRFGELVSEHLREATSCSAIAGALAFWNRLRADSAFELGIATGGWGHTARMKLDSSGYEYAGVPISTSDDGHERTLIMEHCRGKFAATLPTIYIGDGEWDLLAAERLGWRFIGVGARLRGKCQEWVPDFHPKDLVERLMTTAFQA